MVMMTPKRCIGLCVCERERETTLILNLLFPIILTFKFLDESMCSVETSSLIIS